MTANSITIAASTEAAHRDMDPGKHGENNRAWFVAGAGWGYDQALAQEPTDAEVEAFQDCLYERTLTWVPGVEVRAALSAARAARRVEENR